MSVACAECGAPMYLREGTYGKFYGCSRFPDCHGTHGAHQSTGLPLGTPADAETKRLRIAAHDAFDRLWRTGAAHSRKRRSRAYRWLRDAMKLSESEAHIGAMNAAQCRDVIRKCRGQVPFR